MAAESWSNIVELAQMCSQPTLRSLLITPQPAKNVKFGYGEEGREGRCKPEPQFVTVVRLSNYF